MYHCRFVTISIKREGETVASNADLIRERIERAKRIETALGAFENIVTVMDNLFGIYVIYENRPLTFETVVVSNEVDIDAIDARLREAFAPNYVSAR
jgi:hypothetical protein